MPRVTMKDGIDKRTLSSPLSKPADKPTRPQSRALVQSDQCQSTIATPRTAPLRPRTDPTERSIPPMIRTSVMPAETTVRVGMLLASVLKVLTVRKFLLNPPNRIRRANQTRTRAPYSLSFRSDPELISDSQFPVSNSH